MNADLHCHTKMSDGSTCIDEVIMIAKRRGIKTISITDHDTFAGSIRGKILGKRLGIEVITGAEISAYDYKRNRKVHVLCYLCSNPERLEKLFRKTSESRKKASLIMLQQIMKIYPINPDMVARRAQGSTNIFKQHIMHALIDAGYSPSIYGNLYNKLFNSQTGLAAKIVEYPDIYEVIEEIHSAGGLAILAHPNVYDSFDLLGELVDYKLDGVEVWHPSNNPGDEERLMAFAKQYNLLMTGGTDFHGMYSSKPNPLGTYCTPIEHLNALKKRKETIKS